MDTELVLDREAVLDCLDGDEEAFQEISELFLEEIPLEVDAIEKRFQAGDACSVAEHAHAIKGAAGSFGAMALQKVASGIESASRAGRLDEAGSMIANLRIAFTTLRMFLEDSRDGSPFEQPGPTAGQRI